MWLDGLLHLAPFCQSKAIVDMELYQYERLPQPGEKSSEIRLAQLKQGSATDDIRILIHKYTMWFSTDKQITQLPFQAFSYTWGDPKDTAMIAVEVKPREDRCDFDTSLRSLSVTKNLATALKHMRSAMRDYFFWIDAICIDQGTDEEALQERAWQVRLMHHIYKSAGGVVVWLGPEADDSDYAIEYLRALASTISVDWKSFGVLTPEGVPTGPMQLWYNGSHLSREHRAVVALLERLWFTRVWITQEALLANEDQSLVLCGTSSLPFSEFRRSIHCITHLMGFDITAPDFEKQQEAGAVAGGIAQRSYSDIPNLMMRVRRSQCYDGRDKVYGNLGIVAESNDKTLAASILVDYSPANTTERVYMDFFKCYHERYSTLRLLTEAGLCQGSDMRPTWVPDWRQAVTCVDWSLESANSHFARAECNFLEEHVLSVLGISAAHVVETYVMNVGNPTVPDEEWCREILNLLIRWAEGQDFEPFMERFVRALCSPLNTRRLESLPSRRQNIKEYLQRIVAEHNESLHPITARLTSPDDVLSDEDAKELRKTIRFLKMYRLPFLRCSDGHVGL